MWGEFSVITQDRLSCQTHTIKERNCTTFLLHKPLKVFLEDFLTRQTMHREKCIEAGLCGHRMPSTREELDEVVTNGSDVIAVQIDKRNVANRHDLSVARLEIFPIDDGVIHLGFDLTHERNLRGSVKCLGGLSP